MTYCRAEEEILSRVRGYDLRLLCLVVVAATYDASSGLMMMSKCAEGSVIF
jgi:hypothetical protein